MLWLILLVVFLSYGRSLPIYFSGDDWVFLYESIRGFDMPHIFRFSPGSFAPVINFSFAIFYRFFQLNQMWYHIVIMLIHTLNCLLLFYITREISNTGAPRGATSRSGKPAIFCYGNKNLAALTAILFSIFSAYNQIVIWISGLAGLITSVFFLSALYGFILYRRSGKRRYYSLSVATFVLALMCKEWAVTVFGLFILYDVLFYPDKLRERGTRFFVVRGETIRIYTPFILILAVYLAAEFIAPYSGKTSLIGPHIFSNFFTYITGFILPSRNISELPVKSLIPLLTEFFPILVKLLSVLFPVFSIIAIIKGSSFIRFYILWIYINLFPFLFFQWGTASRYYYIPAMGFIAVAAHLYLKLAALARHKGIKYLLSVCLIIFTIIHISFLEMRITRFRRGNEKIRNILEQLQVLHTDFPDHSRLFFSGFAYSRKWSYAVRTVYRNPTLVVFRNFPSPEDIEDKFSPVFIFDYEKGELKELADKTSRSLLPSFQH